MPKLRMLLICLLVLTLPVQAMAGVSMHISAAMQMDSPLHGTSAASIEESSEHCHDPVSAEQKQVGDSSCSHCTVCMSAAAIGSPLSAGGSVPLTLDPPLRQPVAFSFIPDTPERPPRLLLA